MADAPDVWELVLRAVEDVRDRMVTRDQYLEAQRGTDKRFEQLERRQAEGEAKGDAAHAEIHARLSADRREREAREREARESRGRTWLAIGVCFLGVVGPRVWEVMTVTGDAP